MKPNIIINIFRLNLQVFLVDLYIFPSFLSNKSVTKVKMANYIVIDKIQTKKTMKKVIVFYNYIYRFFFS